MPDIKTFKKLCLVLKVKDKVVCWTISNAGAFNPCRAMTILSPKCNNECWKVNDRRKTKSRFARLMHNPGTYIFPGKASQLVGVHTEDYEDILFFLSKFLIF